MHIDELYLRDFGKFHDRRIYLDEDLQVFYGENEYGKSTIYAFIKAMLFGLQRGRGRAAAFDEYNRYKPWDNPGSYSGSMRFTSGNRHFIIERNFNIYEKSVSLICEDDGEELSVEDGDLEVLLGGLTKESFENTLAIGQLMSRPGSTLADELKNCASGYYETGSDSVDLSGALEDLKDKYKKIDKEINLLRNDKNKAIEEINHNCEYIQDSAKKLEADYKKLDEKIEGLNKRSRLKELSKENEEVKDAYGEDTATNSAKKLMLSGIAGIAVGLFGNVWSGLMPEMSALLNIKAIKDISIVILAVGIIIMIVGLIKNIKSKASSFNKSTKNKASKVAGTKNVSKEELETKKEKEAELQKELQLLKGEQRRLKEEWKENATAFGNLQDKLIETEMPGKYEKELQNKKEVLTMASKRLIEVSRNILGDFSGRLNTKASNILGRITDGKYDKILIDDKLDMVVIEGGKRILVQNLSEGTIEQIYFALRVSAAEILFTEPLPIVLDETFAFYDEKRLKSTLKWLREQQRQVIIFTCHRREEEILKAVK